jgi:hypothetical protein
MSRIMSRLTYMTRIFLSIAKHVRITSDVYCCFSILCQSWLASIQNSRRCRFKIVVGGSLLPRAVPLLLPRARRWEALAATTPLLPRVRRRLHRITRWRCEWWLLLLRHAWRRLHPMTPPRPPRATTMNAPTSKR